MDEGCGMKVQAARVVFQRGELARKVAVIVPLHNYAHLIEETIASVAAQSFGDIALIVVDDASTDDSLAVAEACMRRLAATGHTLVLLANHQNAGLSVTRNTGVDHARSEYCFFLDADNLLLPRCVEKHVRALDARPDCAGAYAMIAEFGGGSGLVGSNVFSRERLGRGNYIDAMVMLRRDSLLALDGFHAIRHGWEDFELWLRMCEQGLELLHLPEVLSRYRHHQNSMLRQQTNVGQNILDLHRTIEELHPWVRLNAPLPQSARRVSARSVRAGQTPTAEIRTAQADLKVRGLPVQVAESDPYKQYQRKIFAKIDDLSKRPAQLVDVEIDTDFTGPAHGTPFDSFVSERQRQDSAKQTVRMLQLGIVAINPRPGVHAARRDSGGFLRYRSIAATRDVISQLPSSMLIHIHAFYPDVVEEMLDCFVGDAQQGRFLVTTTTRKNHEEISHILEDRGFRQARCILIENKGRDIGPFLDHAVDHASKRDVICHIHTKKSPDVGGTYGEKWRRSLYGALLTQSAVDAFGDDRLGLLFPDTSRSVGWGKNRPFCQEIAARFGGKLRSHPGPIPVGNMFFARVEVAQAMREATLGMAWPREPVPYDGSVLHAIERMWPTACEFANLDWAAIHVQSGGGDSAANPAQMHHRA